MLSGAKHPYHNHAPEILLRLHDGQPFRHAYTGITSRLTPRMWEHKNKVDKGFKAKDNVDRLLYYETYVRVISAIAREKQIKGMRRSKKVALIESINPSWKDLSREWLENSPLSRDSSPAARNDACRGREQS